MTAAPAFQNSLPCSSSRIEHGMSVVKNLARNETDHVTASRRWFSSLLWRAFPAHSEADLAAQASRVLDVSPRQVTNWLRCNNDASLRYVIAVMALAGAEVVFEKMDS